MSKKIVQVIESRRIVRLMGLSSFNPILINGKANAQKIIGKMMRSEKYFLVDIVVLFVNVDIAGRTKKVDYL